MNCLSLVLPLAVSLTLVLIGTEIASGQDFDPTGKAAQDELTPLTVALDPNSSAFQDAEKAVSASLPQTVTAKSPPHYQLTADNRYVLFGDLFGTGHIFALVELTGEDSPLGFAAFDHGQWQLRGIWNLGLTWRPKEWQSGGGDYLPAKPAEKPFELQDFDSDGVPEVIAAGEVAKYYQSFYLFQFDPETNELHLIVSAMARPVEKDGYLLLEYNSGHRAIWGETDYLRWKKRKLVEVASWHDETPYNGVDPSFTDVSSRSPDGTLENFHFEEAVIVKNQEIYTIQKDGQPFAKVTFSEDKPIFGTVNSSPEEGWLFEHLTGLPLSLYPSDGSGLAPEVFRDESKITIEADKVAKKRLLERHTP